MDNVTYKYKDSNSFKTTSMDALKFIHSFLQHVLPKGFVKVRYFGFLAQNQQEKFNAVKAIKHTYAKGVREWINKIDKDWEHYTLFLVDRNVPPTTNFSEQYFSSTLQKSEKKKFRSLDSLNEVLKIERIKKSDAFLALISVLGLNFIDVIAMFCDLNISPCFF